jgi:hypothetical protein
MIGLGKIFNRSYIYGCESWVMAKPEFSIIAMHSPVTR